MIRNIQEFSKEIIMSKVGHISKSTDEDIIYLIGKKNNNGKNTFCEEMEIVILDGSSGKLLYIDLKDIKGYNPIITLGEYKSPREQEILFTIEEKDEKNGSRARIYELNNEDILILFDSKKYLQEKSYNVSYEDNYKVNLYDNRTNEEYIINIANKNHKYLDEKYNPSGKLKKIFNGDVMPPYEISAIKSSNREVNDILLKQKIIGEDKNDILGEIFSVLRFNGNEYEEVDRRVSILSRKNTNINLRKENLIDKKYDFSRVEFIESEYNPNLRIERAIEKEFSLNPGLDKVTYLYNRVNIKNSPKYQIIVYIEGPKFCTERGGMLIVLEDKNNEYVVTSKIKDIVPPIIISEEINNMYNDLIVRGIKRDNNDFRILRYNGNSYPMNPLNEAKLKPGTKVRGIAIISDDLFYRKGIEY
ncbi:MAG: hypothetical protein E7212_12735 [Clostridium sartagoforme]|nr:hypothetical protein [Clostridium sartagoforme]